MQLHGVRELLGGGIGVAGRERGLADGTRQGGEGIAVAGLGGDPREGLGAGVRLGEVALPAEEGGAEAQTLDGVVMVLAAFPEGEQRAAALRRSPGRRPRSRPPARGPVMVSTVML